MPEDKVGLLTYERLSAGVQFLRSILAAAGIERGDRVALALPNGPEFMGLLLAVGSLGAAAAPLNPRYTTEEFSFYLDDLRPRALILPARELAAARRAAAGRTPVVEVSPGAWPRAW